MTFDKSQILDLLRSQGKGDTAAQADRELPDTVDTGRDAGLLEKFGLSVPEIVAALSGGGGVAGIAGRLASAAGGGDHGQGDSGQGDGGKGDGGIAGKLGGLLGR